MTGCPSETDVFVIGGGPAGLAAALAARRAGFEVVVADRVRPPIDKACGEGLMPDGVAALRRLGVDLDPDAGRPFHGIRFIEGDLRPEASFVCGQGIGIRRPDLHRVLMDRAHDLGVVTAWRMAVDGIEADGVRIGDKIVRCRWIVGADGIHSRVRAWTGVAEAWASPQRLGLRQRFRARPWTDLVEVYWTAGAQAYVTPTADDEVCVTTVAARAGVRMADLATLFPELARRLSGAEPLSPVRGAITLSAKLRTVARGRIALIGDASGSVDAVTGEGLSLAFRQAAALGAALAAGDLAAYETTHRELAWPARLMAHVLSFMSGHDGLRRAALRTLSAAPGLFERLLAFHVGADEPPAATPLQRACDPA